LKTKLKGLRFANVDEIQEAVTDGLNRSIKRNFRQLFRNNTTAQKPVYMPMELILNKKIMSLPHVSSIFLKKTSVQKLLNRTLYYLFTFHSQSEGFV
jgi:hypothetical protein